MNLIKMPENKDILEIGEYTESENAISGGARFSQDLVIMCKDSKVSEEDLNRKQTFTLYITDSLVPRLKFSVNTGAVSFLNNQQPKLADEKSKQPSMFKFHLKS